MDCSPSNEEENKAREPPKRSRWFSIRTYFSHRQLDLFLMHRTGGTIRHWAYCYHDKEECEPHFHIVLNLTNARTLEDVEKWFSGFHDEKGMEITKFVELLDNRSSYVNSYEYLLHLTSKAREEKKHIYDKSERIVDDLDFWENYEYSPTRSILTEAVLRLHSGDINVKQAVKEYGRDFIIHYRQICELLKDLRKE